MSRVVRAFLVWVMVIAIPVQGLAASMMLSCGPNHGRMTQGLGVEAPVAPSGRAGEAGHDAMFAAHDHAAAGAAAAAGPSAHADSGHLLAPDHGPFGCSACAACCSVLALPASFSLPAAAGPAHPLCISPSTPVASQPPDGLDRPPRAVLA